MDLGNKTRFIRLTLQATLQNIIRQKVRFHIDPLFLANFCHIKPNEMQYSRN